MRFLVEEPIADGAHPVALVVRLTTVATAAAPSRLVQLSYPLTYTSGTCVASVGARGRENVRTCDRTDVRTYERAAWARVREQRLTLCNLHFIPRPFATPRPSPHPSPHAPTLGPSPHVPPHAPRLAATSRLLRPAVFARRTSAHAGRHHRTQPGIPAATASGAAPASNRYSAAARDAAAVRATPPTDANGVGATPPALS